MVTQHVPALSSTEGPLPLGFILSHSDGKQPEAVPWKDWDTLDRQAWNREIRSGLFFREQFYRLACFHWRGKHCGSRARDKLFRPALSEGERRLSGGQPSSQGACTGIGTKVSLHLPLFLSFSLAISLSLSQSPSLSISRCVWRESLGPWHPGQCLTTSY